MADTPDTLAKEGAALGFYNVTASLATRFLWLPVRIITRIRQLDDIMDQAASQGGLYATSSSTDLKSALKQRVNDSPGPKGIPGLWGFLTSGYFVGLLLMVRPILHHDDLPPFNYP